jgi:hypothetical protein
MEKMETFRWVNEIVANMWQCVKNTFLLCTFISVKIGPGYLSTLPGNGGEVVFAVPLKRAQVQSLDQEVVGLAT